MKANGQCAGGEESTYSSNDHVVEVEEVEGTLRGNEGFDVTARSQRTRYVSYVVSALLAVG